MVTLQALENICNDYVGLIIEWRAQQRGGGCELFTERDIIYQVAGFQRALELCGVEITQEEGSNEVAVTCDGQSYSQFIRDEY